MGLAISLLATLIANAMAHGKNAVMLGTVLNFFIVGPTLKK
jgi:hypothetical protein